MRETKLKKKNCPIVEIIEMVSKEDWKLPMEMEAQEMGTLISRRREEMGPEKLQHTQQ